MADRTCGKSAVTRSVVALVAATVLAGCTHSERPAAPPRGEQLFYDVGCLQCHTFRGNGARNLGAPDLTHAGRRRRGVEWQIQYLRCPRCKVPESFKPSYRDLRARDLRALAEFVEAQR